MDWTRLMRPALHTLGAYRPGLTEEQIRRERGLDEVWKFSSNEAPLPPSEAVTAAMRAALAQSHRYPDTQAFTHQLARHLGVPADRLVLGNGSIDVIASVVRALVAPQHNVVLSEQGYCAYPCLVQEQGATIRLAASTPGFGHDVERLLAKVDERTRLVMVDSPGNLSGQALSPDEVEYLAAALPPHVLLLLDEAYAEFADGGASVLTAQLPLRRPNVVVTRTFSKAYGLAGLRIGYAVADAGLAEVLQRIRPPFPVSRVALAAASAALEDRAHMAAIVALVREGRQALAAALRKLGVPVIAGSGNFVLADFGRRAGAVHEALLARGCITRPMNAYGLPTHIRITVGTPPEVQRLAAALREALPRATAAVAVHAEGAST
jgi:histidinol-phosphate aminotransferase